MVEIYKDLKDVRNGVLSPVQAEKDYGVKVNSQTMEIDQEETNRLRSNLRCC